VAAQSVYFACGLKVTEFVLLSGTLVTAVNMGNVRKISLDLIGNSNENMVKLMLPDTIKAKFR
jgi:hypothetical protein